MDAYVWWMGMWGIGVWTDEYMYVVGASVSDSCNEMGTDKYDKIIVRAYVRACVLVCICVNVFSSVRMCMCVHRLIT